MATSALRLRAGAPGHHKEIDACCETPTRPGPRPRDTCAGKSTFPPSDDGEHGRGDAPGRGRLDRGAGPRGDLRALRRAEAICSPTCGEHEFDVIVISAFTQSALLATAIATWARSRGAVTILGGPHARCFPTDAARWFDWVLGFTDKEILRHRHRSRPAPPDRRVPLGGCATARAADAAGAVAVPGEALPARPGHHRRPDDREPRVPVHVLVLHRRRGAVPAPRARAVEGRSRGSSARAGPTRS